MLRSNKWRLRCGWLGLLLSLTLQCALAWAADDTLIAAGRRIYTEGVLPSGEQLTGQRFGNVTVQGREAACVQCHKRSGMGSVEGEVLVAPITGNYLFAPVDKSQLATMDPRRGKGFNLTHMPYDEASLARAVRTGVNVGGQTMHGLMPRYALDPSALNALSAYLHQLSVGWSLGAGEQVIRFATIVAPDLEPTRRKVVLDMLRLAVQQKNASTVLGQQHGGRHHMTSAAELVLGTERKWQLDVWELQGTPQTWRAQLENFYRQAPVFAVLSGAGAGTWEPVHDFCEAQQLPCWFPAIDLPPAKPGDFYSVYFSAGVLLEADVLAKQLQQAPEQPERVIQVFRDDEVGRGAAAQLRTALAGSGIALVSRAWPVGDAPALAAALSQTHARDALVLWLRAEDASLLASIDPPAGAKLFFSGQLLGGEHGVPGTWKKQARLVYPYELPQKRALSLSYFHQWLRSKRLPLVDEALQSKVYFAASFMTDTLVEMLDNLHRDYLLERAETMIGRREGSKAEEEAHSRQMQRRAAVAQLVGRRNDAASHPQAGPAPTPEPETMGLRQSTTVFPRLTLGNGQRFASKGAYIVRFADTHSDTIIAESDWTVP